MMMMMERNSSSSSLNVAAATTCLVLILLLKVLVVVTITAILLILLWIRQCRRSLQPKQHRRRVVLFKTSNPRVITFFHPYCSAGGGGERVLWKMIQALEEKWNGVTTTTTIDPITQQTHTYTTTLTSPIHIVIYTIDPPTDTYLTDVLEHVKNRFDIVLNRTVPISFVHLHDYKHLLRPSPYLSLLMESINTMRLAYHALRLHATTLQQPPQQQIPLPHIYIDTTGCAFTYIVPKLLLQHACKVIAYVHYPTISTDMLQVVYQRRPSYNHNVTIAKSVLVTYLKLLYYTLFAMAYGIMGGCCADLVLVNSTWTYQHVQQLWGWTDHIMMMMNMTWWSWLWRKNNNNSHERKNNYQRIQILFPPCNVARLNHLPLEEQVTPCTTATLSSTDDSLAIPEGKSCREVGWIVSIGQFRPEKDHPLQLRALALLLQHHPELLHRNEQEQEGQNLSISQKIANASSSQSSSSCSSNIQLILIGSCRSGSTDDEQRVRELQQLAQELNITNHVVWVLNQSTSVIVDDWLRRASIGIHSMWNEHFGIAIVEMMAAGLVVVAHNSGGPQTDILKSCCGSSIMDNDGLTGSSSSSSPSMVANNNPVNDVQTTTSSSNHGFLASTVEEYAQVLYQILTMNESERLQIRKCARESVERFSDQIFVSSFQKAMVDSGMLPDYENGSPKYHHKITTATSSTTKED